MTLESTDPGASCHWPGAWTIPWKGTDMTKASVTRRNRAKYDIGLARLESGDWTADIEAGQFYGADGQPIGYLAKSGYRRLTTMVNGTRFYIQAHCLLWEYANGPIPEGMEVNHINGIKSDNRAANLELVTPKGNSEHAYATGLTVALAGEQAARVTLTDDEVIEIRRRAGEGEGLATLGRAFGVTGQHVGRLVRGVQRTRTTPITA